MSGENGIKSKLWRAVVVAYFIITVPFFLLFRWGVSIETYGPGYNGEPRDWGNTILWFILIPVIYIIITDILRGAVFYIDSGKYKLGLWSKIKSLFE